MKISVFPEDGQACIVLGMATSTCFVDNMCMFREGKVLLLGCVV